MTHSLARLDGWSAHDIYLVADKAHQLYLQGQYREACILFEGLLAVDPSNRYCRLALSAVLAAKNDLSGALAQLEEWIAMHPRDVEARARRCELLLRLNLIADARQDLDTLEAARASAFLERLQLIFEAQRQQLLSEAPDNLVRLGDETQSQR
ncbi:MAG: hypothetical protein L0387_29540 [Acidobacteria bacterium]|nr:hypothetical protein [Acidobacteriota bacterium]MCI0717458.1 hypothetical protein [Acidobacteriota bacterium]